MRSDETVVVAIILTTLYNDVFTQVLDTGVLYVPIHESYHLKCQNKTGGRFNSFVWRTSAYSRAKHDVYTYFPNRKEDIHHSFMGRVKRYDGTSLHIDNAQPEDGGNWECNILFYYKYGDEWKLKVRVLAVYDVVVVSPPTITRRYPEIVSVLKGYQANAFCDAHGLSPFNLTWKKEKNELSNHVKFVEKVWMKGKYYSKRSFMNFEKLSPQDVGKYTCVALNMAGRAMRSIEVKMQERPKIISRSTATAHESKEGVISCNATGYPRVSFTWKIISNLEYIYLKSGESNGKYFLSDTIYSSGGTTYASSKLHIRNVAREDWGVYTCIVESSIGYDRKDISLSGFSLPSPPIIKPTKKIFSNQVDLKWDLGEDGGSPIKSITVQYKENLIDKWSTIQTSRPLYGYTVTNLNPNSIYDFRVLCTNHVGDSKYSEIFHVQTSSREPEVLQKKQTIGDLGIISFIGVCGAALVALTCTIGCICLYFQERRLNRYQDNRHDTRAGTQSLVNHYN